MKYKNIITGEIISKMEYNKRRKEEAKTIQWLQLQSAESKKDVMSMKEILELMEQDEDAEYIRL